MDLVLLPNTTGPNLKDIYHRALSESVELYIVSAYLTDWGIEEPLGQQCKSFLFIVGKDFGITRKAACEKVISWLPKKRKAQFLAAESIDGFHPKAMIWRELDGAAYALVGSSNLSKAAFSTNHEANGYSKISQSSFDAAKAWIQGMEEGCVTLDHSWLALYREAIQPKKPTKPGAANADDSVFDLGLPLAKKLKGLNETLTQRRQQMRHFRDRKEELENLVRKAARARLWNDERNMMFYHELQSLWVFGDEGSRFQGAGWERQGKGSNFKELATSLARVLDAEESARDEVVAGEIDRLADEGVTTRGALFSEMLCQFFPKRYHLKDKPVSDWLKATGASKPRGASKGFKYIHSARLLRAALKREKDYPAKNLAELDAIIWLAVNQDRY
ncbi:hypothetical protein ACVK1X_006262 [Pseudomonas sp. PvR086]